MSEKRRHIHIGGEGWADDLEDAHVDVVVTFPDSSCWISDFYTMKCIESMRQDYSEKDQCLKGAYWCASSPSIIVDNVSRERIEQVVDELIERGTFKHLFEYLGSVEEASPHFQDRYPENFFDEEATIDSAIFYYHAVRLVQMLEHASEEVRETVKKDLFKITK